MWDIKKMKNIIKVIFLNYEKKYDKERLLAFDIWSWEVKGKNISFYHIFTRFITSQKYLRLYRGKTMQEMYHFDYLQQERKWEIFVN